MYYLIYMLLGVLCYMFISSDLTDFNPVIDTIIVLFGPIIVFGITILNVLEMIKVGFEYIISMIKEIKDGKF